MLVKFGAKVIESNSQQAGFQHERNNVQNNHYQIHLRRGTAKDVFVENVVDAAIGYLKTKHDATKPFYLNMGTQEVHASMWKKSDYYTELYGRPNVPTTTIRG